MARFGEFEDCVEPKLKRRPRGFKQGADRGVNVMAAPLTGKRALCPDRVPLRFASALGAFVPLTEADLKEML